MDGVEGLSRKRRRSEDFSRPAKKANQRKTISCADGIQRKNDPEIKRANKSLTLVSSKILKTPKSSSLTRRSSTPRSRGPVGAEMRKLNKSPVKSANKNSKSPVEENSTKLLNTHAKSKIPLRMSLSKSLDKAICQRNLGISRKSISKVHHKPLLKKSVLDRAVKPFSPSKRAAPIQTLPFVTKIPSSFKFVTKTKQRPLSLEKASPKKEDGKSSTSFSKNKIIATKLSPKKISSKDTISETKISPTRKSSPKNVTMKEKPSSAKRISSPTNKNMVKTHVKNITFSVKTKLVRKSIDKRRKSKNRSMEVKPSPTKETPFSLNKSMPAMPSTSRRDRLSKSQMLKPETINSKPSDSNVRSTTNKRRKSKNMSMEVKPSSTNKTLLSLNKSMPAMPSTSRRDRLSKSQMLKPETINSKPSDSNVRSTTNKRRKSKNMSMEVKPSSTNNTLLYLNKSMPAMPSTSRRDRLSKSQMWKSETSNTEPSDSNDRSATNKSIVITPVIQVEVKDEQMVFNKTPKRIGVPGGNQGNELSKEIKKMSYSSAVKRKPVNKMLAPQTSKLTDKKPVAIPRNIIIQANRKPAFSSRHINSPDPIIISRAALKSLGNKSVGKVDLKKTLKPKTPKVASKFSMRGNNTASVVKKPSSGTRNLTSQSHTSKDTAKTPIILKASASKSETNISRRKMSLSANMSSALDAWSTPSQDGAHNITLKNDSVLKSCMKQNRGLISCKKVNFDTSNLNSKSCIYNDLSINSDICNENEIVDVSNEPSKCFLAALELRDESVLDGTSIISSPLKKRTRRSTAKSHIILPSSTPIHSVQESHEKSEEKSGFQFFNRTSVSGMRSLVDFDWLANIPTSSMLMVHSDHSKHSSPGGSTKIECNAGKNILNLSKSNAALSHNLSPCEVYLTPHITAETLNISVENFVSPLTPGALGLNESKLSSEARKSVSNSVSGSLEVLTSTSKRLRQSPSWSKTPSAAKTTYSTKNYVPEVRGVKRLYSSQPKSPKNDLHDVRGVKRLLSSSQKSPKNDLQDVRGVKRLLSSPQKSPKNDLRDVRGVKRLLSSPQKSPKNDLQDVRGVKRLLSSPQKSPKNDLRDVRGVKRLLSSPQKSPKNDLQDVKGVKRLLSSPQKSPKNDLRDVRGVKRLLSSPQKSPKNDQTTYSTKNYVPEVRGVKRLYSSQPKSPKNDLHDVRGVKRLLSSSQKSPKNDLQDVRGVKRLLSSPQKSPKNDLRDVRGVKRLLSSPQKSPKNDLQDVRGVKRLLSSPQKSPKNDLRDVRGVKRLLSSPQKSPKNDLQDVKGVKRLLSSPQKSPKNDLRDVRGVKRLLSSPQKSPKNDLRDVRGVKRLLSSPQKSPKNDLRNVNGVKQLLTTPPNTSSSTTRKKSEEQKPFLTTGIEKEAIKCLPPNVHIKVEGKAQHKNRKLEIPTEEDVILHGSKCKVKQETDSCAIDTSVKLVQRRTRRNFQQSMNAESELSEPSLSNPPTKGAITRKTKSKEQDTADTATKAGAAKRTRRKPQLEEATSVQPKRTRRNKPDEINTSEIKSQSSRKSKTAGARKISGSSKLRTNLRRRKSSGVLVVSAKKVQFNPNIRVHSISFTENSPKCEVKTVGEEKKGTKSETRRKGTTPVEKETHLKGKRATKATTAVLKSEVKSTRGRKKNANPGTSIGETSSVEEINATPLKAKRATRAKKGDIKSEGKSTRGKKSANSEKSEEGASIVEKESPVKEKRTQSGTKTVSRGVRTTRARKTENVPAEEKSTSVVKAATTSRKKVAANKENVPVSEATTPPSDVPRRVLRKR